MLKNYLKIVLRSLLRNKTHFFINIAGLSVGMTVTMLIGLWIYDELSFNKYHQHYDRIAQVMWHSTYNGERIALAYNPYPMGNALRAEYGSEFKYIVMSTYPADHVLALGENKFMKNGDYMDPDAPAMLSLDMIHGTQEGLKDPASILLSASVATAFFGDADPVGKVLRIDNSRDVKVTGVYKDLPYNSDFKDLSFIASWELYTMMNPDIKTDPNAWMNSNNFQTLVQLKDNANMDRVSAKIKNIRANKISKADFDLLKPDVYLAPMPAWHLYSDFKDGAYVGRRVPYVWMFGTIGIFVLLLACINFMNLSTARSEKYAREVGIRKVVGSLRIQLIVRFLSESMLAVAFAFVLALGEVLLLLPWFNSMADKKMSIPWTDSIFWLWTICFCIITALLAGSYPALYLSSFRPVKVLKGSFKAGKLAILPRKVLVVLQFIVSVILIIGTIVVFRQIEFARNRMVGYQRANLITVAMQPDIQKNFNVIRDELKESGAVSEMAASSNSTTDFNVDDNRFSWKGKDPGMSLDFAFSNVSYEYGKTIGWQVREGRDFSRSFPSDSSAFILTEAAARNMGLKHPVGETIRWNGRPFTVIGVISDIFFLTPYRAPYPSIFNMTGGPNMIVTLKMNPGMGTAKALARIEAVFNKYDPSYPFEYKFVDEAYAKKLGDEVRTGQLASFFSVFAIFISCLGLFGMASFMAEQRTKEIGVRKILGATVFNVWQLLSKEFITLFVISLLIAIPAAWYFMHGWLQKYEYRTQMSWWIFALAGGGALAIVLLTVSYQTIKAALRSPVKSIRTE